MYEIISKINLPLKDKLYMRHRSVLLEELELSLRFILILTSIKLIDFCCEKRALIDFHNTINVRFVDL